MNQQEQQQQYERMTKTPIPRLITTLAIPTMISMIVTAVYNMADTFFVSQLGTSAAGAVGIVFSLMALIQAVGFTLGMGSGAYISRLLGQQNYDKANEVSSTGFFTALFFGAVLSVVGLLFLDPIMGLLGATPTILPFARDYAKYILFGAPVMCSSFVMNNLLRSEGKASLAMIGIASGGVLNIILDPIFIFVFDLGISGAAIATLISQCISFLILLGQFLRGKSILKLQIRRMARTADTYGAILRIGFPSFCRQGLASLATVALNVSAAVYGDAAVAAMSIVGKIFMIVISVMIGFGQGFQPVCGYNYGSRQYRRVKSAIVFSMKTGVVLMLILCVLGLIFAPQLMALFRREDAEVISIGAMAIRAQCVALPLFPIVTIANMTFQVLGRSGKATLISAGRQGIFFLPLIAVLPHLFGIGGVVWTQALADVLTFIMCVPFLVPFFRELNGWIAQKEGAPAQ